MLGLSNLSVAYGDKTVVHDISFDMAEGEIICLVGPTGCGKSTVLRTVAGLEVPQSGEVHIGDLRITRENMLPPEKRNTGLVFQDFALFPHLNVEQNISFRLPSVAEAEPWMEMLGLLPFRKSSPLNLSGGQKQRVALARALAHKPDLMLLDEPLSNLDAALKSSLRWEIKDALKSAGVPAIWVTHDQEEAMSIGDRVGVMRAGKLEQLDDPEQCFQAPANRFVAEFLGEAEFLKATVRAGKAESALGVHALQQAFANGTSVDVLLRPNDLSINQASAANAVVEWQRYEGETRLYGARLEDGQLLKVRVHHQQHFAIGAPVSVSVTADFPLAAFVE